MNWVIANTIWYPIFVYRYNTFSALLSFAVGFAAEYGVFMLYTRSLFPAKVVLTRLVIANFVSYVAGHILICFAPLARKLSFEETATTFAIAYVITVPIEFLVMQSLLRSKPYLVFRAVTMSNFISYTILFVGYLIWFFNWSMIIRRWLRGE